MKPLYLISLLFLLLFLGGTVSILLHITPAEPMSVPAGSSPSPAVKGHSRTYAIVYPTHSSVYQAVTRSAEQAASERGVRLVVRAASDRNLEQQARIMQTLIDQQVDGIAVSPVDDSGLAPYIDQAAAKGIPVVVFETDVPVSNRISFLGLDHYQIGYRLGQQVLQSLHGQGMIIGETGGLPGQPKLQEQLQGFRQALASYPNVQLLEWAANADNAQAAVQQLERLIDAHPHFDAFVGFNAVAGEAAVLVWKAKSLRKLAFAFGDTPILLEGIRNGQIEAAVSQFGATLGGRLMEQLELAAQGKPIPSTSLLPVDMLTSADWPRPTAGTSDQPQSGLELAPQAATAGESTEPGELPKRKIALGFSQLGAESKWRLANTQSIQDSASKAGLELHFTNANQDQSNQIAAIRSFIERRVDVIAFSPVVETGWEEVLAEAKAAGIPVVITDRKVQVSDPSLYLTFIGSNFELEGRNAAKFVLDKLGGREGPIHIVEIEGTPGSAPALERKKGFWEQLQATPRFQIMSSVIGDFTRESGRKQMRKLLEAYGSSIHVLFAHNDDMALGAIEAIEAFGLKPGVDIVIVSVDGEKEAFQAMLDGKLNGTVECNPLLGPQLIQAVKEIVAGRNLPKMIVTKEDVFSQGIAAREIGNRNY